ncbi:stage III sporulation protein AB [Clostridium sp. D2Q-11]|uniref:Stage III sporulation protein AB n=1 Tax=Anaeromonas frigoriresistens TaxID=2683708 RepID=A0A942UYL3_9FIRM|nr:stage III sporulation protein AB [Anaeromonas frigoriresistens]MBS4539995.1 stage III sporulation protein AB [Anaeromonas frigoriresistens]
MFFIKIIACGMIFIPSAAIGIMMGKRFTNRVNNITSIINCLLVLETEIIHLSNPINLAFENVDERTNNKVSNIFSNIIEKLNSNRDMNLYSAFKNELILTRSKYNFTKEDEEIILSLAKVIGVTDKDEQGKHFSTAIQQLKIQRDQAIEQSKKNENLYKKLGIVFGLLLILILI